MMLLMHFLQQLHEHNNVKIIIIGNGHQLNRKQNGGHRAMEAHFLRLQLYD
jgi:hypothetical protein